MRYDEFRDQLEAALQRNSLHFHGLQRVETIELANTVRPTFCLGHAKSDRRCTAAYRGECESVNGKS